MFFSRRWMPLCRLSAKITPVFFRTAGMLNTIQDAFLPPVFEDYPGVLFVLHEMLNTIQDVLQPPECEDHPGVFSYGRNAEQHPGCPCRRARSLCFSKKRMPEPPRPSTVFFENRLNFSLTT
jgi:hypothetical protein